MVNHSLDNLICLECVLLKFLEIFAEVLEYGNENYQFSKQYIYDKEIEP